MQLSEKGTLLRNKYRLVCVASMSRRIRILIVRGDNVPNRRFYLVFSKDLHVTWNLSVGWAVLHNGPWVTECTRTFWQHIGWMGCTPAAGCSPRRLRSLGRLADHFSFLARFTSNATEVRASETIASQMRALFTIFVRGALGSGRHHVICVDIRLFIATPRHNKCRRARARLNNR